MIKLKFAGRIGQKKIVSLGPKGTKCYFFWGFLLLILSLSTSRLYAQKKMEREYGIKASAAPERARAFAHKTYAETKVKWYREESLNGFTIEAKLKWEGKRHSIEFDTLGKLQDIEITIQYQRLNDVIKSEVDSYLSNTFHSYRIDKAQLQLTGNESSLQAAILNKTNNSSMVHEKYELVVEGKRKGDKIKTFYEILIDEHGKVVHQLKIVERRVNHLIF